MSRVKKIVEKAVVSIVGPYNYRVLLSKIKGSRVHNYEESDWIFRYFKKYKKSGVMIDVGAHHGESFAPYLKLDWQIYAFEPDPDNFALLKRNVEKNGYRNTALIQKAVTNENGEIELHLEKDNIKGHSILNLIIPKGRIPRALPMDE